MSKQATSVLVRCGDGIGVSTGGWSQTITGYEMTVPRITNRLR